MTMIKPMPVKGDFDAFLREQKTTKQEPCKGLVFRCERTAWGDGGEINFKTRFRLLKRKSCPGCEQCDFLWEDVGERLSMAYDWSTADPIIHEGVNGKMYRLMVTNMSTDWETGICDDYDLELREYNEEDLEQNT